MQAFYEESWLVSYNSSQNKHCFPLLHKVEISLSMADEIDCWAFLEETSDAMKQWRETALKIVGVRCDSANLIVGQRLSGVRLIYRRRKLVHIFFYWFLRTVRCHLHDSGEYTEYLFIQQLETSDSLHHLRQVLQQKHRSPFSVTSFPMNLPNFPLPNIQRANTAQFLWSKPPKN